MKKLLMIAAVAMTMVASAVTQVYNYTSSVKFPTLNNGVRTYQQITFKGTLEMTYDEENTLESATLNVKNMKSKVWHKIDFTQAFYNLMGKSNKRILRQTPTVAFVFDNATEDEVTTDDCNQEPHEKIVSLALGGDGTLRFTKTKVVNGCGPCSPSSTSTEYCHILQRMCGRVVGVADCLCPEDENWNHTVVAAPCGMKTVDGEVVKSDYASFYGTWSANYSHNVD